MSAAGVCEVCGIDLDAHTVIAAEACASILVSPECQRGDCRECDGSPCEHPCHTSDIPGVRP